jgi:phosphopantothenoylcysteine decarboxylase / phosphopantothenate---cysteine ligase
MASFGPHGREIVLGIGAGIAAYKSCDLLRRLQDRGFLITVVPTPNSLNFVGKATWEALSHRRVHSELWEDISSVPHIKIGSAASFVLIAPATADLIARIAAGRADDLLTNVVLSTTAPILLVPAMHPQMWLNSATVENVATLRSRGVHVMEPSFGRLTGDDVGIGRFPTTEAIIDFVEHTLGYRADLLGKKVLITGGGTREPIDPVRYIGNRSSGKQGMALAQAALTRGAQVTLILGPNNLPGIEGAEVIEIETAEEMRQEIDKRFTKSDIVIMSAAVADARPIATSASKIKKKDLGTIILEENPDILATLAKKRTTQFLVGFAAESENDPDTLVKIGSDKLEKKGVDLLYVNNISEGAIFSEDQTSGAIIAKDGQVKWVLDQSKLAMSDQLLDEIVERINNE